MINKILALSVILIPIAYIYSFPLLINNLGNAIQLFICFPLILSQIIKSNSFNFDRATLYHVIFSIYFIFISFVFSSNSDSESARSLVFFIIFSFGNTLLISYRNFHKLFLKYYKIFSLLFSIFLIFQFIAFEFFSLRITGILPFLKTYIDIDGEFFVFGHNEIVRISSVFIEPSHFALYVIPALNMHLWKLGGKSKHRTISLLILLLAVILSTSGNGVIFVFLSISAYIYKNYLRVFTFKHFILGIILIYIILMIFLKTSFIQSITYSLFTTEVDRSQSKADARVYRGFLFYSDLPLKQKILGVGWKNAENFSKSNSHLFLYEKYYLTAFDYFNTIAAILIYSGITGFLLFVLFLYYLWKNTFSFGVRFIIFLIFTSMFSSSIIMTEIWPLYLTIIFASTYTFTGSDISNKLKQEDH